MACNDPYGRYQWLRSLGLSIKVIRNNRLLDIPDDPLKIILGRVLREKAARKIRFQGVRNAV
jgi:hypothetical protein